MKARLGELQARLESHEARRAQSADANDSPAGPTSHSFATKAGGITDESASRSMNVMAAKPDNIPPQPLPPHFMQQPNLYEQPVDDPENSLFPHLAPHGMLSSPPPSQQSPAAHGLLSPPTHAEQQGQSQASRAGKHSHNFMMDCLRFQSQLLSRLNNLQQETSFPESYQGAPAMSSRSYFPCSSLW